eukprot:2517623-Rhodomonas_salina.1
MARARLVKRCKQHPNRLCGHPNTARLVAIGSARRTRAASACVLCGTGRADAAVGCAVLGERIAAMLVAMRSGHRTPLVAMGRRVRTGPVANGCGEGRGHLDGAASV